MYCRKYCKKYRQYLFSKSPPFLKMFSKTIFIKVITTFKVIQENVGLIATVKFNISLIAVFAEIDTIKRKEIFQQI